jgi:hypothetical protein
MISSDLLRSIALFPLYLWQGKAEGRALFGLRLAPDPTAQPTHNFLAK